jgi:hypothetical protein
MAEVIKNLKPLLRPFFRPVRPRSSPFRFTPWIANNQEALAPALYSAKNRIRMATDKSLHSDVRESITGITETIEVT